jgi:hypothetical protein
MKLFTQTEVKASRIQEDSKEEMKTLTRISAILILEPRKILPI